MEFGHSRDTLAHKFMSSLQARLLESGFARSFQADAENRGTSS